MLIRGAKTQENKIKTKYNGVFQASKPFLISPGYTFVRKNNCLISVSCQDKDLIVIPMR